MKLGWLSLVSVIVVAGCKPAPPVTAAPPPAPASQPASAASQPADPMAEFAAIDKRVPVPMPPPMAAHHTQQMREHLEVVQAIVVALSNDDFDAAKKEATKIAFSNDMAHQCEMMGRGASGFTEQAVAFHKEADQIVAAAAKKDTKAALKALAATIATCTGCHATFRTTVVSWSDYEAASQKH